MLLDLVHVLQEVSVFFFEFHHGVCELFINFRQGIQFPFIESIETVHSGVAIGELAHETGHAVVVSLIKVRILDIVETLHLH